MITYQTSSPDITVTVDREAVHAAYVVAGKAMGFYLGRVRVGRVAFYRSAIKGGNFNRTHETMGAALQRLLDANFDGVTVCDLPCDWTGEDARPVLGPDAVCDSCSATLLGSEKRGRTCTACLDKRVTEVAFSPADPEPNVRCEECEQTIAREGAVYNEDLGAWFCDLCLAGYEAEVAALTPADFAVPCASCGTAVLPGQGEVRGGTEPHGEDTSYVLCPACSPSLAEAFIGPVLSTHCIDCDPNCGPLADAYGKECERNGWTYGYRTCERCGNGAATYTPGPISQPVRPGWEATWAHYPARSFSDLDIDLRSPR